LSGTAGTVGASALSSAAKVVERALGLGAPEALRALADTLAPELRRLHEAWALLRAARATAPPLPESTAHDHSTPTAGFDHFIGLLEEQSIEALEVFVTVAPELRALFSDEGFAEFRTALDTLQYNTALRMLATVNASAIAAERA
jgi:hypothetical protein